VFGSLTRQAQVLEGDHSATVLAGERPDAYHDVDRPTAVVPEPSTAHFDAGRTILGPHSLTVVR
jgi:hypothetical protein